jgi:hypothetical protein
MLLKCPRRSCNGSILMEDTGHGKEYVCIACNRHWAVNGRYLDAKPRPVVPSPRKAY